MPVSDSSKVMLISETTGAAIVLISLPSLTSVAQGISALNPDSQVLYVLVGGHIFGISVRDTRQSAIFRIEQTGGYGTVIQDLGITSWSDTIIFIETPGIQSRLSGDCCDAASGCPQGGRLYACSDDGNRKFLTPFGQYTLKTASGRRTLCDDGIISC